MNTPVTATSGLYMGCLEKASFQPSYMNPMAGQEVRYYEHYPNAYSHPITAVLGEDGIKVMIPDSNIGMMHRWFLSTSVSGAKRDMFDALKEELTSRIGEKYGLQVSCLLRMEKICIIL